MFPQYSDYPSFNEVFKELKTSLLLVENQRKQILFFSKLSVYTTYTSIMLPSIGFIYYYLLGNFWILISIVVLCLLALLLIIPYAKTKKSAYIEIIKENLIPEVIHLVNSNLIYYPWEGISGEEIYSTNLFGIESKTYRGEDYLEGKMYDIHFRICELKLNEQHIIEKRNLSYNSFFNRLIICIELTNFPKNGYAVINTNNIGKSVSDFNKTYANKKLTKFETDNSLFNKAYNLFGNSKEIANFIFTQHLIDVLFLINGTKNTKNINCKVEQIVFVNEKAYFAINHKHDLFSPNLQNSFTNKNSIKQFYDDLIFVLDLVETIIKR